MYPSGSSSMLTMKKGNAAELLATVYAFSTILGRDTKSP